MDALPQGSDAKRLSVATLGWYAKPLWGTEKTIPVQNAECVAVSMRSGEWGVSGVLMKLGDDINTRRGISR
jgi:hypothetical protein